MAALTRFLNWLDGQRDGAFWLVLYLVRWPVVIPLGYLQGFLASALLDAPTTEMELPDPVTAALGFLVLSPILETAIECTIPYVFMKRMRKIHPTIRPWSFVIVSACVMAVLHAPYAILLGFVTGSFLAYCYGHFAPSGQGKAFLYTAGYHAAINLVGWVTIYVLGSVD